MTKKLDTTAITNELSGASSFFRHTEQRQAERLPQHPPEEPKGVPPYGIPRTPVPPRRPIRQRQPYDVFEDQHRELKRIADEERNQGLPGSMSRMVREAIDQYLAQRKK
jgi:hypothetical protein